MQDIRAITLDLDDTLWAIGPVIRRAEAELWQWLSEQYPRIVERWTQKSIFELRLEIAEQHPGRAHDFRFLRRMTMARVAVDAGYDAAISEAAFDVFDAARNRVELFPDVQPALEFLSAHFTLVAITNGNADVHRIGIGEYFAAVVTSTAVGVPKPDRAIFDAAVNEAGVRHAETLHVGDHPELDVAGARNAGMRTAWINRFDADWPDEVEQADATLRDIDGLKDLLQPALAARGG